MIAEVKRLVGQELAKRTFFGFGVVVETDWQEQRARVRLLASGMETNWLRVGTGFASADAGNVAPLADGDEVLVCFPGGNPQGQGVVLCRLYGANKVPEVDEQSWAVKRGNGYVVLDANGKVAISGTSVEISSDGQVTVSGSQISLGGTSASAVKYEMLNAAFATWAATIQAALAAATPPVVAVITPPVLTAAQSVKVKLV